MKQTNVHISSGNLIKTKLSAKYTISTLKKRYIYIYTCTKYMSLTEVLLNSRKLCFSTHLHFLGKILIPREECETHKSWWRELGRGIWLNLRCLKELDMNLWLSVFLRFSPCQGMPPGWKKITPGFVEQSFHFIRTKKKKIWIQILVQVELLLVLAAGWFTQSLVSPVHTSIHFPRCCYQASGRIHWCDFNSFSWDTFEKQYVCVGSIDCQCFMGTIMKPP